MTGEVTREEMVAWTREKLRKTEGFALGGYADAYEHELACLWGVLRELEAGGWRPIGEDQRDGELYILWREEGLDPFIGYWDSQFAGWFSLAGAYVMEPNPTHYLPLSALPAPPTTSEGGGDIDRFRATGVRASATPSIDEMAQEINKICLRYAENSDVGCPEMRADIAGVLSALSPLIEAAREVDRTWPEYVPNMDFVLALAELRAALSTFPAPASPSRFVDIVFDGPPSHESGRFVEVESPPGTSIRFGEWLQRDDGYWVLRFAAPPTTSDR